MRMSLPALVSTSSGVQQTFGKVACPTYATLLHAYQRHPQDEPVTVRLPGGQLFPFAPLSFSRAMQHAIAVCLDPAFSEEVTWTFELLAAGIMPSGFLPLLQENKADLEHLDDIEAPSLAMIDIGAVITISAAAADRSLLYPEVVRALIFSLAKHLDPSPCAKAYLARLKHLHDSLDCSGSSLGLAGGRAFSPRPAATPSAATTAP